MTTKDYQAATQNLNEFHDWWSENTPSVLSRPKPINFPVGGVEIKTPETKHFHINNIS